MSDDISRYVKIDDWIFEVKMVRAIRTERYGEPYSATASVSLNGQHAFIDGLMTSDQAEFTRDDYQSFRKFFAQMNVDQVNFDRYKQNKLKSDTIPVFTSVEKPSAEKVSVEKAPKEKAPVEKVSVKEIPEKEAPLLQLVLG
ncbi:hypothetical protein [Thalassomonas actiniarum]|uniref:Uncharacterized protein n=1 Tax=Thalassomonas actiniarum TaxID=485447 RepID=A0AAE9YMR7_9GAMM|nr:hypothetical protein [Thalassomonas actiniarum]WDD97034.1 hypothetical protein SG35_016915 [Thalassomonas actiniarum]